MSKNVLAIVVAAVVIGGLVGAFLLGKEHGARRAFLATSTINAFTFESILKNIDKGEDNEVRRALNSQLDTAVMEIYGLSTEHEKRNRLNKLLVRIAKYRSQHPFMSYPEVAENEVDQKMREVYDEILANDRTLQSNN